MEKPNATIAKPIYYKSKMSENEIAHWRIRPCAQHPYTPQSLLPLRLYASGDVKGVPGKGIEAYPALQWLKDNKGIVIGHPHDTKSFNERYIEAFGLRGNFFKGSWKNRKDTIDKMLALLREAYAIAPLPDPATQDETAAK